MPRTYRVPYTGTLGAAGTDTDLLSIQPADDKPVRLVGWIIGQTSELADAAEEALRVTIRHMTATFTVGSGGSSVTPVANRAGTTDVAAAACTTRCNDTTVATSSGNNVIAEEQAWNIRSSPWERWIPEELRPVAIQGEAIVVRCESTPADDITVAMTFFIEELPEPIVVATFRRKRIVRRPRKGRWIWSYRGRTYYVAASGGNDSNDGLTTGTAWATSGKVTTEWAAGRFRYLDGIHFELGGTYGQLVCNSGSSGHATGGDIQFRTYGSGAPPIFTAAGAGIAIEVDGGAYITFTGYRGTGSDFGWSLEGASHHLTLIDCEGDLNAQDGAVVVADTVTIAGGSFTDNGTTTLHHGIYFGAFGADEARDYICRQVVVTGNAGAGVQSFLAGSGLLDRIDSRLNDTWGVIVSTPINGATITVQGSLMRDAIVPLEVEGIETTQLVNVFQNTMARPTSAGVALFLDSNSGTGVVRVENNIIDGTGALYAAIWGETGATDIDPLNNILWRGDAGNLVNITGSDFTLAAFYSAIGGNPDPTFNFIGADPLFVNAGADNFHLQSGSPARDEGDDLGVDEDLDGEPLDATPDLGAYQFVASVGIVRQMLQYHH